MQLPTHPRPNILTKAACGLVAAVFLTTGATSFAGGAEIALLSAKLGGTGKPTDTASITSADPDVLATKVAEILTENAATKYKTAQRAGLVAGEALKYNNNPATPDAIAAKTMGLSIPSSSLPSYVGSAAKTAGTGKALNVSQIPDFAVRTLGLNALSNPLAITAAEFARNKPGAGAILGGQASQELLDDGRVELADTALANPKLKSAVIDIARYIGATADNVALFAENFANGLNSKVAVSIGTGASAGKPTEAGQIALLLFNSTDLQVKSTMAKQASTYAKKAAAVSDIEELQKIGNVIGKQMATGGIKTSKAAAITKTLVKAIVTAPASLISGTSSSDKQLENRRDEAAEVAAYMIAGMGTALSAVANDASGVKAAKLVLAVIKAAVSGFNNKKPSGTTQDRDPSEVAADVAASVAWTIEQGTAATLGANFANIQDRVQALLTDPKIQKSINKLVVTDIGLQVAKVYDAITTNDGGFENGFEPLIGLAVSDPETDIHPL